MQQNPLPAPSTRLMTNVALLGALLLIIIGIVFGSLSILEPMVAYLLIGMGLLEIPIALFVLPRIVARK